MKELEWLAPSVELPIAVVDYEHRTLATRIPAEVKDSARTRACAR